MPARVSIIPGAVGGGASGEPTGGAGVHQSGAPVGAGVGAGPVRLAGVVGYPGPPGGVPQPAVISPPTYGGVSNGVAAEAAPGWNCAASPSHEGAPVTFSAPPIQAGPAPAVPSAAAISSGVAAANDANGSAAATLP